MPVICEALPETGLPKRHPPCIWTDNPGACNGCQIAIRSNLERLAKVEQPKNTIMESDTIYQGSPMPNLAEHPFSTESATRVTEFRHSNGVREIRKTTASISNGQASITTQKGYLYP